MKIDISTMDAVDSDFIIAEVDKLTFALDNGVNQARVSDMDSAILREWLKTHPITGMSSLDDFYVNNEQHVITP